MKTPFSSVRLQSAISAFSMSVYHPSFYLPRHFKKTNNLKQSLSVISRNLYSIKYLVGNHRGYGCPQLNSILFRFCQTFLLEQKAENAFLLVFLRVLRASFFLSKNRKNSRIAHHLGI